MPNRIVEYLPITSLLAEIIDNRGKSVPTVEKGFPLIATNCIKESSIYPTFDKVRFVDDHTYKTWFRAHLQPNDILFVNKGTPGKVCLVPNPVTFCAAQDMMGFRCNAALINYKYLFAVLRSDDIQKTIQNNHVGLVIPHFRKQDLSSIMIPVISRIEQDLIGNIYIAISEKIELNNRINAELEAMAKTIYDYWFVQFDFPNFEGKPYKSSGGKMVWCEELKRETPEGWKKGTLSDLGDIIGGSTPPREISEYFTNEGTAWITPKDLSLNTGNKFISKGELDVSDKGLKAASLNIMPKGTILLSSRAPIGYLAISREKVTTNQGFKSFVPNKGYSTEYVYYSVKNMIPAIENNAVGSTFKEVSATTLKSISIFLADKQVICKYTETVLSIFNRQDLLEQENQQLSSLRDWLLPMLMNGQVSVVEAVQEFETLIAAEPKTDYKCSKSQWEHYHKIESVYAILWANKLLGVQQGEMALAKDTYLIDKIAGLNTGFTFAQHNWGSYDPTFKKTINNKQYFVRRSFENSKATYFDLNDNEKLLARIPETMKEAVRKTIEELHTKVFFKYQWGKKAEMKELYATVLKCIEDTQSIDLAVIRQTMKDWKTPKQDFLDKAAKFCEAQTKEALDMIVKEGWDLKVIKD